MPVTATASLYSPAVDEPRAELDDLVSARFSPTDPGGNAITSVTATFDGVSKTVTLVAIAGGIKDASFPATFYLERTHSVSWSVTTADANVNVFAYDFTARDADWGPEFVESFVGDAAWSAEAVALVVTERVGGFAERVELVVISDLTSTSEMVELNVGEGLGAGYFSIERVELIVASLVEIDVALSMSIEVGEQSESRFAMSIEVEDDDVHNSMPMSLEVYSEEYTPAYALSLEVSIPDETRLPLSIEVGTLGESRLPLSLEVEGSSIAPVAVEIRLTNEDLAAAEESMSASEADA